MSGPPPAARPGSADVPRNSPASWLRATALLVGGALAFGASFLPLGQAVSPALDGEPATTLIRVPAQELATVIQVNAQDPASASLVGTAFWAFALWGAPLALAGIGLLSLLGLLIRRVPVATGTRSQILAMLLVVVGAGFTLVSCWGYLTPFFGTQGATRSLAYGPGVALLGYLGAQAGLLLRLPRRPGPDSRRAHA